ncbi:MAG: hypothetical protein V3W37_03065 [Candidatus Binatia bacterium]
MAKEQTELQTTHNNLPMKLENIQPGDDELYNPEDPVLVYAKIRHKDLKGDDGKKVICPAGGFVFSDGRPDMEVLTVAVIGARRGRVYFEGLEDTQPKCKSLDGINGTELGPCAECSFGQFLNSKSPKCKEIRNLLLVELAGEALSDAYILTLGPSGLKPWRLHDNQVLRLARRSTPKITAAPHFLLRARFTTEYRELPAAHFVPVITTEEAVSSALAEELRKQRKVTAKLFSQGHEGQAFEAEDFTGNKDGDDEGLPF